MKIIFFIFSPQSQNDQEIQDTDIDCFLAYKGSTLATGRIFQPIPQHETPVAYCLEFNRSVHLEPGYVYEISVSVSKRTHFLSGI